MPITQGFMPADLFGKARTALTNALGREPDIFLLAITDFGHGYRLAYGVHYDGNNFAPFTMRYDRLDVMFWPEEANRDFTDAAGEAAILVSDLENGHRTNPHRR